MLDGDERNQGSGSFFHELAVPGVCRHCASLDLSLRRLCQFMQVSPGAAHVLDAVALELNKWSLAEAFNTLCDQEFPVSVELGFIAERSCLRVVLWGK